MQGILASLSAEEQATLKLCGISQDAQLARTSAALLAQDLQRCKELFPSQTCEIPPATLQRICEEARRQNQSGDTPAQTEQKKKAARAKEDGLFFTRACPTLVLHSRHRSRSRTEGVTPALPLSATDEEITKQESEIIIEKRSSDRQERIGAAAAYDYHNAVHNTHSVAVYLGAWATILMVLDVCAVIIIPVLVILGFDIKLDIREMGVGAVVCALPYICLNSRAVCSVCRIGIFSFKKYSHNRQAHWMPLLGCALPTALHVAFRFWFRCPACGTPQKLFRRPRHRR